MDPPSPSVINVNLQLVNGSISRLMAGGVGRSIRQVEIEI
jgi:hypothetical protein